MSRIVYPRRVDVSMLSSMHVDVIVLSRHCIVTASYFLWSVICMLNEDVSFVAFFPAICFSSLLSSSFMIDISTLISINFLIMFFCGFSFVGTFSSASMVLARAVFRSLKPSRVSSTAFGTFAPSRLLGCAVNSTCLPSNFTNFLINFLYTVALRHCILQDRRCLSFLASPREG